MFSSDLEALSKRWILHSLHRIAGRRAPSNISLPAKLNSINPTAQAIICYSPCRSRRRKKKEDEDSEREIQPFHHSYELWSRTDRLFFVATSLGTSRADGIEIWDIHVPPRVR